MNCCFFVSAGKPSVNTHNNRRVVVDVGGGDGGGGGGDDGQLIDGQLAVAGEASVVEDESMYAEKSVGIKLVDVGKSFEQFGVVKQAVRHLSLNIYEGQITVLLGHNGAGKSTTISMITGLTEPTSGRILVNGLDIVAETMEARKALGFCPQHNLLFEQLSVYEHLLFFAKLKENLDESEIDEMLAIIGLADKKHAQARTLSGGMKRKLSVAIAFIGRSRIVILDEPSSGMDPQARHSTWTLLQKFKKERHTTILLTTHFMDEADILGDRIAIMANGQLKCCGSPLFLKSKYGSGYNFVVTKKRSTSSQVAAAANAAAVDETSPALSAQQQQQADDAGMSQRIVDIVHQWIPSARLTSNINTELGFVLPAEHTSQFSGMFEELERRKHQLNIVNIGVSVTTLEDVFLRFVFCSIFSFFHIQFR